MTPLDGPRRERRQVLHGGARGWATPEGDQLRLDDGRLVETSDVVHLPPCSPTKILCVHTNYMSRIYEIGGTHDRPVVPTYFQKPLTALNGHGAELRLPEGYKFLNYEGELAAIVGRPMRNVTSGEVWDHIAGFTVANDVTIHDLRDADMNSMLRVKGADGLCPLGPGIVWGVDVRAAQLRTWLNGELVQEGDIAEQVFGLDELVADLARHITLDVGDVILTGTPANSRPMKAGDVVEVEVTGVGRLRNVVVATPAPRAGIGSQPQDNAGVRKISLGNDERLASHLTRTKNQV